MHSIGAEKFYVMNVMDVIDSLGGCLFQLFLTRIRAALFNDKTAL